MAEVDRYSDILDRNMRVVWPTLAAAIRGTGGPDLQRKRADGGLIQPNGRTTPPPGFDV